MFANRFKTFTILTLLAGLLTAIGYTVGGIFGGVYAIAMALIINGVTYFYADRFVLSLYKAKPLPNKEEFSFIHDTVGELCGAMNMPIPRLYLIETPLPNAFATGRNPANAVVAVTRGIVDLLEPHELRGVLAHELAHVQNRDILIATIAATLATAISYCADIIRWGLFWGARGKDNQNRGSGAGLFLIMLLTPFIAMILQLAISRTREYLADETGTDSCQDPLALASALRKLGDDLSNHKQEPPSTAHASAASLFIVYPFRAGGLYSLFSTHPPLQKRIERLEKMAHQSSQ